MNQTKDVKYNQSTNQLNSDNTHFSKQYEARNLMESAERPLESNGCKSCVTSNSSDSSTSSFYIRSFSWESSEQSNQSDAIDSRDSRYQPKASTEHPYATLATQLKISARCDEDVCENAGCNQVKILLYEIQKSYAQPVNVLNRNHGNLMVKMYEHCVECSSLRCPFYWCCNIISKKASREEMVDVMLQRITNWVEKILLPVGLPVNQFIKFDNRILFDDVHKEDSVWTRLCMMGYSSKNMLVIPHEHLSTEPKEYWVVKKVARLKANHSWNVYMKLAELRELRSVTPLLWAMNFVSDSSRYIICSSLEGLSLHEHLQSMEQLVSSQVVKIMLGLTAAVEKLHSTDIVYLNWTSKNVLISQGSNKDLTVKLINFDSSAVIGVTKDVGAILPVHLLPPELLEGEDVELASDLWGMGCLLYELTTCKPVWHQHRHETDEELKELMKKNPHPDLPDSHSVIFEKCWKVDPKERIDVPDLHNILSKY